MIKDRFTLDAEYDLNMFANHYDLRTPGLGDRFIADVKAAVERIRQFPESGDPVEGTRFRRMILKVFDHSVYYVVREQDIIIVMIPHHHTNPESISRRITRTDTEPNT